MLRDFVLIFANLLFLLIGYYLARLGQRQRGGCPKTHGGEGEEFSVIPEEKSTPFFSFSPKSSKRPQGAILRSDPLVSKRLKAKEAEEALWIQEPSLGPIKES